VFREIIFVYYEIPNTYGDINKIDSQLEATVTVY